MTVLAAGIVSQSCDEREIPTFGEERYIYVEWAKNVTDKNFICSFITTLEDDKTVGIPLRFAGRTLTEDTEYAVKLGTETDVTEGEYELPERFVFRKGYFQDTLYVTFTRSERMQQNSYKLVLNLVSNENFLATQRDATSATIIVSDMISQPEWWDETVINSYLGPYSDKKFRLFLSEIYSGDYGALSADEKRAYALQFKEYVEQNDIREDNNEPMVVPVV